MRKYVGLLLVLVLIAVSVVWAEEVVTTKDGKKVLLKDDQTWVYVEPDTAPAPVAVNAKYAEEAVEIWDMSLMQKEVNYSNAVALYLHYKNNTAKKVIGVSVYVLILNPFGKVLLEHTFEDEVVVQPLERMKNDTYRYWNDNPFINDETYDRLWQVAQNGTAKIKAKVMKVIYEDGTVLKRKPDVAAAPAKKK